MATTIKIETATDLQAAATKAVNAILEGTLSYQEARIITDAVNHMVRLGKQQLEQNKWLSVKEEVPLLTNEK